MTRRPGLGLQICLAGPLSLAFLVISAFSAACADDADNSLLPYAVSINRTAAHRSGTGIYLGKGLILTASHVIGDSLIYRPQVSIGGQDLPARIVKQDNFEAFRSCFLLSIDDRSASNKRATSPHLAVQRHAPWPGEDVITVVPEEAVHSHVMSPVWLPPDVRHFSTVISDVAKTGNSGSGVFDAQKKCLLGIMSRKISQSAHAKRYRQPPKLGHRKIFCSRDDNCRFHACGVA